MADVSHTLQQHASIIRETAGSVNQGAHQQVQDSTEINNLLQSVKTLINHSNQALDVVRGNSDQAITDADTGSQTMDEIDNAAKQTNLLALNAAILNQLITHITDIHQQMNQVTSNMGGTENNVNDILSTSDKVCQVTVENQTNVETLNSSTQILMSESEKLTTLSEQLTALMQQNDMTLSN